MFTHVQIHGTTTRIRIHDKSIAQENSLMQRCVHFKTIWTEAILVAGTRTAIEHFISPRRVVPGDAAVEGIHVILDKS